MKIKVINEQLLDRVADEAARNPRLRMNYNFHETGDDPINRLLNVMNPDSYFPVHRHLNPNKQEIFLVLRGSLYTFLFDDNGTILDRIEINPSKGVYGMDIAPDIWHSLIVLEPNTVVYEIKQGPFTPLSPENIASWTPDPSDTKAVKEFMDSLLAYKPIGL